MRTLLQQILRAGLGSNESDADLLRRFVDTQDAEAFAHLVRRHGGLVWGQCRHLLANEADADDAFQATFLVLARSAKSIRTADRLGPWLHGVAYRVCQNARRQAARRAPREQAAATQEATHPVADSAWATLLAAVHEELHSLPESLRVAFILCYLEGKGTTEAAEQLGLKVGTFSSHLNRARERLLARLSARGLAGGAGVLAAMTAGSARAALVQRVVELVFTQAIPTTILTLTQGVLLMGITKLKIVTACALMAGILALGGFWSVKAQSGPGGVALFSPPKLAGTMKEPQAEITDIQRQIEALRAKEQELKARQARLEREYREQQANKAGEFRYLPQLVGHAFTPKEFEAIVHENEKDGYRFTGMVSMKGTNQGLGINSSAGLPTLVFRRIAPPAGMGGMMGGVPGGGVDMMPGQMGAAMGGAGMPGGMGGEFDPFRPARPPE